MLRRLAFGMGLVGTVLVAMSGAGFPAENYNWVRILAAIGVGTGVTNVIPGFN